MTPGGFSAALSGEEAASAAYISGVLVKICKSAQRLAQKVVQPDACINIHT